MWGPIQSPEKEGTLPRKLRPMDASPGRYTGPTAILSRFPGRLRDSAFAHVTSFSEALVLGPEKRLEKLDKVDLWLWMSTSLRPEYRMVN